MGKTDETHSTVYQKVTTDRRGRLRRGTEGARRGRRTDCRGFNLNNDSQTVREKREMEDARKGCRGQEDTLTGL